MEITKKRILKTALMPEILPRLNKLIGSGFSFLPYLLANVYQTVRILPANHPCTQPENNRKYNLREVIAATGNEIKFNLKNIDQIIIFFSVIASLFILLLQFTLLIFSFLIPRATAQVTMPSSIEGFFVTPNPEQDIAFRMLDLVLGVPGFFGSKEATNTAIHQALHSLFQFYSFSMLIVGAMIILYFAVAVVSETATSGVPFGKRFNKSWAPIRLILFFGLLIPISNGLNAAQYITLASAKLGSGLASQGWIIFNQTIEDESSTLAGEISQNIAHPQASNLMHVPSFMFVAKTCEIAYTKSYNNSYPDRWDPSGTDTGVKAWAVYLTRDKTLATSQGDGQYVSELVESQSFQDLTSKSVGNDIAITFGVKDEDSYQADRGYVNPVCGTIVLRATDVSELGTAEIQKAYFNLIINAWRGTGDTTLEDPLLTTSDELNTELATFADNYTKRYMNIDPDYTVDLPDQSYKDKWEQYLDDLMNLEDKGHIYHAMQAQITDADGWNMPDDIKNYGWGGAGIWYNTIAEKNGSLISSIRLTPSGVLYPRVLEKIKKANFEENLQPNVENIFTPPTTSGAGEIKFDQPREDEIANTLNHVYRFWEYNANSVSSDHTGNPLIDTINAVLGTQGLFEICKNTDIHPLAQLSSVGKSMLDNSIRSIAIAGGFGIASIFPSHFSPSFAAASSFYGSIAGVGILIGFMLFYVVPFMPFLYFFFAVGGWVKGIFEAMVAMPLWALAHLRIDGDGIPGEAAISGYYLIFEIFIRPILVVFGLIAAVSIFAAMVKVLNETFYLAISNLSGHDPKSMNACFQAASTSNELGNPASPELKTAYRGPIDEFFFTILYTIIVYIVGTSSFKLIDSIPNQILRWINAEVPTFNDSRDDPAEGLLTYVALGGSQFGSQISGSLGGLRSGAQQSVSSFLSRGQ